MVAVECSVRSAGPSAAADAATTKPIRERHGPSIAPPHWVDNVGRYVVFNGTGGLTLADTVAGTTTVISAVGYTAGATVSGDGRYVAFLDGQGAANLWDRTTGTSEVVSLSDDEQQVLASFYGATVSGDGRYVAFLSCDPILQPPAACGSGGYNQAIYLRDRVAGTTVLVNETPSGSAVGSTCAPSLSEDGGVAVWVGYLLTGADAFKPGVVVWTRATNTLSIVEPDDLSLDPSHCTSSDLGPMVSGDGNSIAWTRVDPAQVSVRARPHTRHRNHREDRGRRGGIGARKPPGQHLGRRQRRFGLERPRRRLHLRPKDEAGDPGELRQRRNPHRSHEPDHRH